MNFGTNINLQIDEHEEPAQKEEVVVEQNQASATKSNTGDNFFCVFMCLLLLIALCIAFIKNCLCKDVRHTNKESHDNVWSRYE